MIQDIDSWISELRAAAERTPLGSTFNGVNFTVLIPLSDDVTLPDDVTPLPLFTPDQINENLLQVWSIKPQPGYLQHLNQSYHPHADLSIWSTPRGVFLRNLVVKHRATFIKALYRAASREDTTTAAGVLIRDLDNWVMELRTYAKRTPRGSDDVIRRVHRGSDDVTTSRRAPRGSRRIRKSTELMVKERARHFTYRATLTRFGRDPTPDTLRALRASFKELWVLKCIV